ncbi:lipoyl synthase [Halobacteriovorax sp. HLS]|uniref:lipoyl synthase n=1 Tax=Halobacteriovorax sp. HLS TaxID=2234000 RepID=UPI000FD849DD|nr:lipoyl synthase [Halobacteriovorax sp. HLS]
MSNTSPKRPAWLKVKAPTSKGYFEIKDMLKELNLVTVCQEALCPNMGECWEGGTATFMLMGDTCTRACRFCAVKTGNPKGVLDHDEPLKVGNAISKMNLNYVVLTSVDRDDLEDGGSDHFAKTIETIKENNQDMIVEVLTPDFSANKEQIARVIKAKPDVFAHNIETVEALTKRVRDRRSGYAQSLSVLKMVKEIDPTRYTKTSIMLGLGEKDEQVLQTLKDLRSVNCDVVTFGQYLSPTQRLARHLPIYEYVTPEKFSHWEKVAKEMGFLYVASGPLVRSSYKAGEYFLKGVIEKDRQKPDSNKFPSLADL